MLTRQSFKITAISLIKNIILSQISNTKMFFQVFLFHSIRYIYGYFRLVKFAHLLIFQSFFFF
jgi:hypothetical protein